MALMVLTQTDPSGDRLERLFLAHREVVRRYARRRGASEAEAQDIVSEVFSVAWRRLDRVPVDPTGWLLAVARRARANQIRSGRRRVALAARLAEQVATSSPEEQRLADSLCALKEGDREVLMLVCWEGLTHAQAAEVMGCSEAALSTRLRRARERLASELHDEPTRSSVTQPAKEPS